ncbi:hypothetical protein B484DRAFT_469106, partial [Ochromonadaceae sp. CCMP2298]
IPDDTALLITQTLKAAGKIPRSDAAIWKSWEDDKFFSVLATIYPVGGQHSHHLHDALRLLEFQYYLDAHHRSLQSFVVQLNEVLTVYEPEISAARAESENKIRTLERESVCILLGRIAATKTDTNRLPHLVRSRLKALCTKDGKPDTVAELIERLFTNAEVISQASIESAECGLTYKRIGKQDTEGEHQRAKDAAHKTHQNLSRQRDIQEPEFLDPCPGCGMTNHTLAKCRLDGHPHHNKTTNVPWLNGTWGVRYAAAGKTCLKYGMDEKGNKIEMRKFEAPLKIRPDREDKKKFQKKR